MAITLILSVLCAKALDFAELLLVLIVKAESTGLSEKHQDILNRHALEVEELRKRLEALEKSPDHSISFGGRRMGRSATSLDKIISDN